MLIIGLGNEFRGDDAFGVRVVELLKEQRPHLGNYIIEQGDSSRLLDNWIGRNVVIVDAVSSDLLDTGTICISDSVNELIEKSDSLFSTHGLDLGHVLELGRDLKKFPRSVYFLGIVGKNWGMGDPMSKDVSEAIIETVKRIVVHVHALKLSGMEG